MSVFLLGGHFLNQSSFLGESSCWVLISCLGFCLLSRTSLPLQLLDLFCPTWSSKTHFAAFDFLQLVLGKRFLNKHSFWDESACWVLDFLFGCQSSSSKDVFLMGLLSGTSLYCWVFAFPVWVSVFLSGRHFLNESPFCGKSSCWVFAFSIFFCPFRLQILHVQGGYCVVFAFLRLRRYAMARTTSIQNGAGQRTDFLNF